ncbi:hypothetical protein K1T71_011496 [Dendrolimus kikuchii]|uniref:Uncharacterized protein n=1 Tax=Dendrolimus kikuchii TaxID=765133 RepID=A0ACC1CP76_9NEOP|nr:hypothetical protein K1T71_011496 [Dendrolimus kikuchii]
MTSVAWQHSEVPQQSITAQTKPVFGSFKIHCGCDLSHYFAIASLGMVLNVTDRSKPCQMTQRMANHEIMQ